MRIPLTLCLLFFLNLAFCVPEFVTITLNNGSVVSGSIISSDTKTLRFRSDNGILTLRQDRISNVSEPSRTVLTESLTAGSEKFGLNSLLASIAASDVDSSVIDKRIMAHSSGIISECSNASTETINLIDTYLHDRQSSAPPELYMICAECWKQAGEIEPAITQLEKLDHDYPSYIYSVNELREWAAQCLNDGVKSSMQTGDADLGLRCVALLAKLDPEKSNVDQRTLRLAEVASYNKKRDYANAMRTLMTYVAPIDPRIAMSEGVYILNTMWPNATETERFKTVQLFTITGTHLSNAREGLAWYLKYGDMLIRKRDYKEATDLAKQIEIIDLGIALKLKNRISFYQRYTTLKNDDLKGKYILAGIANDNGLTDEAKAVYEELLKYDESRENAALQLQFIQAKQDKVVFDSITHELEQNHLQTVIQMSDQYLQHQTHKSEMRDKIVAQRELARFKLQQESKLKPAKADVLLQNAERAFLENKYDAAHSQLLELETDYAGTNAAARARDLRRKMGMYVAQEPDESISTETENRLVDRAAALGAVRAAYDQLKMSLGK